MNQSSLREKFNVALISTAFIIGGHGYINAQDLTKSVTEAYESHENYIENLSHDKKKQAKNAMTIGL